MLDKPQRDARLVKVDVYALLDRVATLEAELANAADTLQRMHPIGEVKHIGLLEVAEATRQIEAELAAVRAEREEALNAALAVLRKVVGSSGVMTHASYLHLAAADVVKRAEGGK